MTVRKVYLSPQKQNRCRTNAEQRDAVKEAKNIKFHEKMPNGLTSLDLHYIGVLSQCAVCEYLGEEMNWAVTLKGCHEPHFYHEGFSGRVQTATHYPPIMKFNAMADFDTDATVLCMIEEAGAVVAIYGCISRERFRREHTTRYFGYGNRLAMEDHFLTPIDDFAKEAEYGLALAI